MQQNSEQLMAGSMRMLWEEDGGGECGSEGYCGSSCVNSAGDGWRVQADKGHGGDDEGGAGGHHQEGGEMRAGVTGQEVKDIVRRALLQ